MTDATVWLGVLTTAGGLLFIGVCYVVEAIKQTVCDDTDDEDQDHEHWV